MGRHTETVEASGRQISEMLLHTGAETKTGLGGEGTWDGEPLGGVAE